MSQQVGIPAHRRQSASQGLADGDQRVGPPDQRRFQVPQGTLVEPGPFAEIVHAVIDPAGHGQPADEVGDDGDGGDCHHGASGGADHRG